MTRARFTHDDAMTLWRHGMSTVSRPCAKGSWCCSGFQVVDVLFVRLLVAWTARGRAPVGPALVSALGAPVGRPVGTPGPVVEYRSRPERRADLAARAQEVSHAAGTDLLTWILVGTVSTVQCKGTVCQPTRTSQAVAGPHKMAVFHSPAACELSGSTMQQLHQQAVPSPPSQRLPCAKH